METLKHWSSLHGYIVFMLLTTVGSACEAPSSPECFRESDDGSVYTCEWSTNNTADNPLFCDVMSNIKRGGGEKPHTHFLCFSSTVKFDAPQNISMFWSENNLTLMWKNPGKHPALAEVWFRRDGPATESWEKVRPAAVVNLLKRSAYQVQIRHRSTQVKTPLWSKWSPVVVVPAGELMLAQKTTGCITALMPMPRAAAAAAAGVNYTVADTQSSHGCPCARRTIDINTNKYTINVTYSAVNISVIARNAAGCSPSAVIQVPAEPMANLESRHTCLCNPFIIIIIISSSSIIMGWGCFYPNVFFSLSEPRAAPEDFTAPSKTHSSVTLSWKAIASVDRRGVLTHYRLCTVKLGSQDEQKCHNVSASLTKLHLEKLTPGAKYNISLAAVTRVGTGPAATVIVSTLQAKTVNGIGLLESAVFGLFKQFLLLPILRIKNRIFPPVPTPVIPDFSSNQPEHQVNLSHRLLFIWAQNCLSLGNFLLFLKP
uniref:Fibronectin type-III domain-containing protein n=1 Tax=Scophthalmus maximus TaxID=52904 RepID=A0A8D3BI85_SCOMX